MPNPWDWCEYYLLVTLHGAGTVLCDHLEQHEFVEAIIPEMGLRAITGVVIVTEETYRLYEEAGGYRVFN